MGVYRVCSVLKHFQKADASFCNDTQTLLKERYSGFRVSKPPTLEKGLEALLWSYDEAHSQCEVLF